MRLLLCVSLAVALAGLTQRTLGRWQSDTTLWCDALALAPEKPRALNNCALAYLRNGDYEAALPLLDRALVTVEQREPNRRAKIRATILTNRVLVLFALRRLDDARLALARVDPADPRVAQFRTWLTP